MTEQLYRGEQEITLPVRFALIRDPRRYAINRRGDPELIRQCKNDHVMRDKISTLQMQLMTISTIRNDEARQLADFLNAAGYVQIDGHTWQAQDLTPPIIKR